MLTRRNQYWTLFLTALLGTGLFAVLIWGNYRYVSRNPGGNDFLVHWVGTQAFIQEGLSPYSDETALKIQTMVYGRAAQPGEHELRVAYPLYSIFLFLPFALIQDYNLARAVWMAVLEAGLLITAFLTLRLVRWKPTPLVLALFLLFSVFWYHGLRPVILGNAVILVALAIVGILLAIRAGQDELAGILLGLITIKPHVVILFIGFICFWAAFNRRWKVILWLIISVTLLSAIAFLLIPDWPLQNLREILRYTQYSPPGTVTEALTELMPGVGSRVGTMISILVGVVTLVEWLIARKAGFRGFLWASCFTLTASQWIGIPTDPKNFVVVFPALVLTFAVWKERWGIGGTVISLISMMLFFTGIWGIALYSGGNEFITLGNPVMFFPLPLIGFCLLYWIRWWAVRPPAVWYELLIQDNA